MKLKALALTALAATAVTLTGCSSSSDAAQNNNEHCVGVPKIVEGPPTATIKGVQGQVSFTVTDDAINAAPKIEVTTPFKVDKTQVKTLVQGTGDRISENSSVSVCYEGVNGRTGEVFDSAYQKGTPAEFSPSGVVEGFKKALVGQKVGSTVAVAMPSAEGYPQGGADGAIAAGDTILFGLKILELKR